MQNDVFYLKEAFQKLNLLNEDSFDLSVDKGVVDELQSFVADDIEAPYEEEIIDIAADNEDELQDSYVGKVILQCDCCHSKIYKEPEEVVIDEESEVANVDEECPVCGNAFGWHVIGKIEPYDEDEFEEKPEEEHEEEVGVEFSEDEVGEALKESLNEEKCEDCETEHEEECDNGLEEKKCNESYDDLPDMCYVNTYTQGIGIVKKGEDGFYKTDLAETNGVSGKEADKLVDELNDRLGVTKAQAQAMHIGSMFGWDVPGADPENLINTGKFEEACDKNEECEDETCEEACKKDESLTEDLDKVEVCTDDGCVEVEKEGDKIIVDLDPHNEEEVEEVSDEEEMIAPLTDEEKEEIMNNTGEEEQVEVEEDEFDIDDFDEESFDELGESFLKRVYENVDSFKTTDVKYNDGKLVVEGLINFKSGKNKSTSFVFENFRTSKRGKTIISGLNEMFSKSSRAFMLKGTLKDKKYVSESLTYNYTTKTINEDNNSEVVRIYGRAVVRK